MRFRLIESFDNIDSEGNLLSNEQIKYFSQSKIRDDNGNLLVCYHGSPNTGFTVFDINKSKNSGLLGKGFYFTNTKSHASTYGNPYEVYLNITHPLIHGPKDITESQILAFLKAVQENEDYGLDNYGYGATPESVLSKVSKVDDFTILFDINNSCIGDFVAAIKLFNTVCGTTYDGIVTDVEMVAFYPNQIKSIANKNPTGSEDINEGLIGDLFKKIRDRVQRKDILDIFYKKAQKDISSLYPDWFPTPDDVPGYCIKSIRGTTCGYSDICNSKNVDISKPLLPQAIKAMKITLNKNYLTEKGYDLSDILNTIYHELAHILTYCYLIEREKILPERIKNSNSYQWLKFTDKTSHIELDSHGLIWRNFAHKLNMFLIDDKIAQYANAVGTRKGAVIKLRNKYLIVCVQCDNIFGGFNDVDTELVNYFKSHNTLQAKEVTDKCYFCDSWTFQCELNKDHPDNKKKPVKNQFDDDEKPDLDESILKYKRWNLR